MTPLSRRQTLRAAGALVALTGLSEGAHAALTDRGSPSPPSEIAGWREAIIVVAEFEPWIDVLRNVGGWEVALRQKPDTSLNSLWSLGAMARTEQVLMRNVGTSSGFIRFVKVYGCAQRRIRPDDQAWETGGIQTLDLRVVDMDATRTALMRRGWRAASDPVRYTTYGMDVIQWVPTSPDGIRLSFIQRISPALIGWSELKHWSRTTNAAITVRDMDSAVRFFRDTLGLRQGSQSNTLGSGGHNVMGLPWRTAETTPVDIRGFMGTKTGGGAIELISLPELHGRDYSDGARPPNLGIAGIRMIVSDVAVLERGFSMSGVTIAGALTTVEIAPYGACKVFAAQSPDGVWLEFLEPVDAALARPGTRND